MGPLIWYVNANVRMSKILDINYNHFHHLRRSQMCAWAWYVFRTSESHSEKLCCTIPLSFSSWNLSRGILQCSLNTKTYPHLNIEYISMLRDFHIRCWLCWSRLCTAQYGGQENNLAAGDRRWIAEQYYIANVVCIPSYHYFSCSLLLFIESGGCNRQSNTLLIALYKAMSHKKQSPSRDEWRAQGRGWGSRVTLYSRPSRRDSLHYIRLLQRDCDCYGIIVMPRAVDVKC